MKERPIIFSGAMVKAILNGRKTQTRRIVKPQPVHGMEWASKGFEPPCALHLDAWANPVGTQTCPHGVPGDRLWVRETWKSTDRRCVDEHTDADHECTDHCTQTYVYYKATPREGYRPRPDKQRIVYLDDSTPLDEFYLTGWRSPLHMPRWASRITLEVTDVRVERLQAISEEDARAEGLALEGLIKPGHAAGCFARLWDEIHGAGAWDENPWVWAITFRRLP